MTFSRGTTSTGDHVDVQKIRRDFPILRRKVNGRPLVFLDSASTSQKPRQVIDAVKRFYETSNSNVHRSVYKTSQEASEIYEGTRDKIRGMLDAREYDVIFTRNCTEAINLVAGGWAAKHVQRGESVVSTIMEHHSNIVPWQMLGRRGVSTRFLDIDGDGNLKFGGLGRKDRLVAVTHVSNVLGTVNDVEEITRRAHENGSLVMLDGAQSTPHMRISLSDIGCDFFAFSGHKMLGPTGIGVLVVRKEIARDMDPILFGSDMIKEVTTDGPTFADSPARFETGTPHIAGVAGLSAAIDYLEKVGLDDIERHEESLTDYTIRKMRQLEHVKIIGDPEERSGVVSFNVDGAHPHDVATIVDQYGVALRSGHHCAQPLMNRLGVSSTVRASFYLYNTRREIDVMISSLEKVRKVMGL